jgi:predicted peptidase
MRFVLIAALLAQSAAARPGPIQQRTMPTAAGGTMNYAVSVPRGGGAGRPLVLALHPGGPRIPNYGGSFMQQIVIPALAGLGAVFVGPDCPAQSWTDEGAERAVMALVDQLVREHKIDARRILVVGFSMGGRGTWHLSSRHADVFTGAIAVAASTGNEPIERLARVPTYVIHSRDDQVVPFEPAEATARQLEKLGRPIAFEPLEGYQHFDMGAYVESIEQAGQWIVEQWAR